MCEQHSYSDCVRLGGSAISFATATVTRKTLTGNRKIGEVTAYGESDGSAVGGVGER